MAVVESEVGGVRSFTLATGEERLEILIAADVDYGFDLGHLHEHEASGDPVRCTLEERDGHLYALRIDDA